jgi:hypothetical protein
MAIAARSLISHPAIPSLIEINSTFVARAIQGKIHIKKAGDFSGC